MRKVQSPKNPLTPPLIRNHKAGTGSKFSPAYWSDRVFRPRYQGGQVAEWYCQIQHTGRREKIALGTNTREEAARRAARLYSQVRSKGWESALAEFAPGRAERNGCPTVGDFLEAVESAAGLNPRTSYGYAASLRWIVAHAFGIKGDKTRFDGRAGGSQAWRARIDRTRLDKLTPRRVENVLAKFIAAAGNSPLAQQRARRSAASFTRQARALFAPRLLRKLPFDAVPNPFVGVHVEGARPARYVSTVDAATLLRAGQVELAGGDPEAWKALLLALGAGLRKREIDNLTWPQVDAARGEIRIQTTDTFQTKTTDSEGTVWVDAGLISELDRFRGRATGLFVLESKLLPKPDSKFAYYRADETFNRLSAWLRRKGILASKPLHALRKEFGSIVAATSDIHTASRQLRHSSIAVTSAVYADNRRRVAPTVGAFLKEEIQ